MRFICVSSLIITYCCIIYSTIFVINNDYEMCYIDIYFQLLKLLTINSQNPYLLWDNSTRAELTDFLETRCRLQPNEGSLEDTIDSTGLSYSRHKSELIIGNVFINIFNDQPTFTVEVQ